MHMKNGCSLNKHTLKISQSREHIDCYEYALSHDCPTE